jgi:hypothetical protein
MSKDKTKEFTNFIKQDFDIVKDYKDASKELRLNEYLGNLERRSNVYIRNLYKTHDECIDGLKGIEKEVSTIKQALTDYTKQTEMLVELREKYKQYHIDRTKGVCKAFDMQPSDYKLEPLNEMILQDINTILEGGKGCLK